MNQENALSQSLASLETQVEKTITAARRRSRAGLVFWIVGAVVTAGYLGFAHVQLSRVDSDLAVSFAGEKLKEHLPDAFAEIRHQGKSLAPTLIKEGESALKNLPDRLHATLVAQVSTALDTHLPALEEQMYQRLKTTLEQEALHQPRENQTREERYTALIGELHSQTQTYVAAEYEQYLNNSTDVLAYLDHLAADKDLNQNERMQRDMLRSMMILWRQHEAQNSKSAG